PTRAYRPLPPLPHKKPRRGPRAPPAHPPPREEGPPPRAQRQPLGRRHEARRQPPQPQATAVLPRRLAAEPRVDVLGVDRLLQPNQLPPQVPRSPEAPLKQRLLEPAVEVLRAAVELRLAFRDEHRADAIAQAQPDHPR